MRFSADAARYFSGEFIFMIFGLPGAALAMIHTAHPENKKAAKGLLISAALTSMLTGITEPIEFSFLFVAPVLYAVQVILAGSAYMVAHILNIAVGVTFSGGFLDLFLFGILQGNAKTGWLMIPVAGLVYFALYYFIFRFLIFKFDFKTPGREEAGEETKLYTKKDVQNKENTSSNHDEQTLLIIHGLGGAENISDLDSCATRLRVTVNDPNSVDEEILKASGSAGVVTSGKGVQIVYGPQVSIIKSKVEDFLENPEEIELNIDSTPVVDEVKEVQETLVETITSPMSGEVKDLSETPDETFAQKMMGDGVVIFPSEGNVYAPFDGEVTFVFGTKHALGLKSDSGLEMLIHIGIDTVQLNGEGFDILVEDGQSIKQGDLLGSFDLAFINENAPSSATPIIFTNLEEETINVVKLGHVDANEKLIEIK